jgi:hypothetical protein
MYGLRTLLVISGAEYEMSTIADDQRVPAKISSMAIHMTTIGGRSIHTPNEKK